MSNSLFFLTLVISVNGLYLPDVTKRIPANDTGEEIQHAICKIASKDLEATANATIFRELKGVCTSVQLETHLNYLEATLLQQFNIIKNILLDNGFRVPETEYESQPSKVPKHMPKNDVITEHMEMRQITNLANRQQEIDTYNDTVVDSNKGGIYFYYWNVENIDNILSKDGMYISSPEFFVLGHSLHLQLYPKYLDDESFAILLRPSSKSFMKKHKIYVVNQSDKKLDIDSGLMFGFKEESFFRVSEESITHFGYINLRVLTVKVEIFVNS
ncbi:uncharacterized protein LOC126884295 [Diabrotica virgifera virgifera]|uniref:TNF family profile domain-containing protein n=1 Tax=Diabrotica virgifera virgifera TaxID=50390 RepID=A0ABM5K7L6_DIAVI|nr:uncharacterized protein LOC126884295 [Diabrotica virgifera virgifera]